MICYSLKSLDLLEAKIPVQIENGEAFLFLGGPRKRKISAACDLEGESTGEVYLERVDIRFSDHQNGDFCLVKETSSSRNQALVLLPPTERFSYISQTDSGDELCAASDTVSLLVVMQPGNKILVREKSGPKGRKGHKDRRLRKKVLFFDGEKLLLKPTIHAV